MNSAKGNLPRGVACSGWMFVEGGRVEQGQGIVNGLDDSASATTEWAAMREVFGDRALCRLVCVPQASLRRHALAGRGMRSEVDQCLHWLVMVVAALSGAYNKMGVRRWFERSRVQLDGFSPRELLGELWHPEDESAQRIRALAETLTGAQRLAP